MVETELDYLARQKSKISPFTPASQVHPRKGCVTCREARKQRRHEKKLAEMGLAKAVLVELAGAPKEAFKSIGYIGQGIARAHGTAFGAWLGNTDPITWAGGGVAAIGYMAWLTLLFSKVKIGDKTLGERLEMGSLMSLTPTTTTDIASKIFDSVKKILPGNQGPTEPPPAPSTVVPPGEKAPPVTVSGVTVDYVWFGPGGAQYWLNSSQAIAAWDFSNVFSLGTVSDLWKRYIIRTSDGNVTYHSLKLKMGANLPPIPGISPSIVDHPERNSFDIAYPDLAGPMKFDYG